MLFPTQFLIYCPCLILRECAPSTSLHVILDNFQSRYEFDFMRSGFVCHDCASPEQHHMEIRCRDCSLCPIGTYTYPDENCCLQCPAGDENKHSYLC